MGRPQSVSKFINSKILESVVKPFKNSSGGYIPVPQSLIGRKVRIKIIEV